MNRYDYQQQRTVSWVNDMPNDPLTSTVASSDSDAMEWESNSSSSRTQDLLPRTPSRAASRAANPPNRASTPSLENPPSLENIVVDYDHWQAEKLGSGDNIILPLMNSIDNILVMMNREQLISQAKMVEIRLVGSNRWKQTKLLLKDLESGNSLKLSDSTNIKRQKFLEILYMEGSLRFLFKKPPSDCEWSNENFIRSQGHVISTLQVCIEDIMAKMNQERLLSTSQMDEIRQKGNTQKQTDFLFYYVKAGNFIIKNKFIEILHNLDSPSISQLLRQPPFIVADQLLQAPAAPVPGPSSRTSNDAIFNNYVATHFKNVNSAADLNNHIIAPMSNSIEDILCQMNISSAQKQKIRSDDNPWSNTASLFNFLKEEGTSAQRKAFIDILWKIPSLEFLLKSKPQDRADAPQRVPTPRPRTPAAGPSSSSSSRRDRDPYAPYHSSPLASQLPQHTRFDSPSHGDGYGYGGGYGDSYGRRF